MFEKYKYNLYFELFNKKTLDNNEFVASEEFLKLISIYFKLYESYLKINVDDIDKISKESIIFMLSYDCSHTVEMIIDNLIINNYFVSFSMSRILIENLIIIKLIMNGDDELIKNYVFLKSYKSIVKYGKSLKQEMTEGQAKFVEMYDNYYKEIKSKYGGLILGDYGWAASEVLKNPSFDSEKISLNSLNKCLQKVYNDVDVKNLYASFDRLSTFSHAFSSEKFANSQFMIPNSYFKETKLSICRDTEKIVDLIIKELHNLFSK